MPVSAALLPEFDQEMEKTRKLLECVPEDKYSWTPHEKSMSMVRLASHVAELPHWAVEAMQRERLELTPDMKPFRAASNAELLARFDTNVTAAHAAIAAAQDEDFDVPWSLAFGGRTAFTMPRRAVLRSVVMNHLIHHRAQLGVYLRLNDVKLPGMYGPSADDQQANFSSADA